jgi:vacuolar-type H+-ATPase subunit H
MSPWGEEDRLDAEVLLRRALDLVMNAKSMPLSASALISREEVAELLEGALERLPEDLRRARWMLREREEYLAKARREAEDIVESARVRAERMVQRTEIVREAKRGAERLVEEARDEARRMRHEAEDYCDRRLANFEVVLERLSRTVRAGREKLRGFTPIEAGGAGVAGAGEAVEGPEEGFFDQDR